VEEEALALGDKTAHASVIHNAGHSRNLTDYSPRFDLSDSNKRLSFGGQNPDSAEVETERQGKHAPQEFFSHGTFYAKGKAGISFPALDFARSCTFNPTGAAMKKSKSQFGAPGGRRSVMVQRSKSHLAENTQTNSSALIFSTEPRSTLAPSKSSVSSPPSPLKSLPRKVTFKPSTYDTVQCNRIAPEGIEGLSGRGEEYHSTKIGDWSLSHLPAAFNKLSSGEFMFVSHLLSMGSKAALQVASALNYKLDRSQKSLQGYSLALRNAINKGRRQSFSI
jgi:hypothetical protein